MPSKQMRRATITRKTNETEITVSIGLDGAGNARVATGIGFFDHMLEQVARQSCMDVEIVAKCCLHIDMHHTVEDPGIALVQSLRQSLGERKGIGRYCDVH